MAKSESILEDEFQQQVIDLAHLFGWKVAHFRKARVKVKGKETWRTAVAADGKGFPDLVLAKNGIVLYRECKTDTGTVSREQLEWLQELRGKIWRPKFWASIEKEIRELGAPPQGTFRRSADLHTTGNS
jgi:hypothetical protein